MSGKDSTKVKADIRQWSKETGNDRQNLLIVMQKAQERYGMLSEETMCALSETYELQPAEVFSLVSLFTGLQSKKNGKYHFKACDCLACKENNSFYLRLKERLGIDAGKVSEDGLFSLERVQCMGMCDLAPVASVNGQIFPSMTGEKLEALISHCLAGKVFPLSDSELVPMDLWKKQEGQAIKLEIKPSAVFSCLKKAPALSHIERLKEEKALDAIAAEQFVDSNRESVLVCNTDRPVPGSFADRIFLGEQSEFLVESLLACAYLAQVRKAILYLRPEYRYLVPVLRTAIEKVQDLARNTLHPYGEATAPCEMEVRISPGFVGGGLRHIVEVAVNSDRFAGQNPDRPFTPVILLDTQSVLGVGLSLVRQNKGTNEAKKVHSYVAVAGACKRPGMYSVNNETKLSDLLQEAGCEDCAGVWLNGLEGNFHAPRDFDKLLCEFSFGSFTQVFAFGQEIDFHALAGKLLCSFSKDSCGQCVPCRDGLHRMSEIFQHAKKGSRLKELELISIAQCVQSASKCEYGRNTARCYMSLVAAFPEAL
jgi:[NiFe] hydrogenase diaphorase moiety large subunit